MADLGGAFVGGFRAGTDAAAQRIINAINQANAQRAAESHAVDMRNKEWAYNETLSTKAKADQYGRFLSQVYAAGLTENKSEAELRVMFQAMSNMTTDEFGVWFEAQRQQSAQRRAGAVDSMQQLPPSTTVRQSQQTATANERMSAQAADGAIPDPTPTAVYGAKPVVPSTPPQMGQVATPSYSAGGSRVAPIVAPTLTPAAARNVAANPYISSVTVEGINTPAPQPLQPGQSEIPVGETGPVQRVNYSGGTIPVSRTRGVR